MRNWGLHLSAATSQRLTARCVTLIVALVVAVGHPATASAETVTYTATQTIPVPPASTYAGSGGGDGWAAAVGSSAVYNIFHHDGQMTVACHLQLDSTPCWVPRTITDDDGADFATSGHAGLWLDQVSERLYSYGTRTTDGTGGVVCIDIAGAASNPDPFCGFTALTGSGSSPLIGLSAISNPVLVGSRWFAFNYASGVASASTGENELLCFDTASKQACNGQPFALAFGSGALTATAYPPPAVTAIGSHVIVPMNVDGHGTLGCLDADSNTNCAGSWPVAADGYPSGNGAAFPYVTATGVIRGFCLPDGSDPCFALDGGSLTTPDGMTGAISATSGWNGPALSIGPRVFVPNGNQDQVDCFDYATSSSCPNFPLAMQGLSLLYTVNRDPARPTCIWVNADSGAAQIQNFDAFSGGACGEGPIRVLASSFVVPSDSCIPATYTSLQVLAPPRSAYSDGTVSFQDGDANPVPGIADRALDGTGTVRMSDLNLSTSTGLPQFLITLAHPGDVPTPSVEVQLTWTGAYDPSCVQPGIVLSASLPAQAQLTTPGDAVTVPSTSTLTFSWTAALQADSYDVLIDGSAAATGIAGTSFTLSPGSAGLSGGHHTWQVRSVNDAGATLSLQRAYDVAGAARRIELDGSDANAARLRLGFHFLNSPLDEGRKAKSESNVSWSAYVLTWGRDQTYTLVDTDTGELLPDPDAQALYDADRRTAASDGFQCFGFASIAALREMHPDAPDFAAGTYDLASRYPDYDSKLGITLPDPKITVFQDIHARFKIQNYGRAYLDHAASWAYAKVDAVTVRASIEQALNAGQFPMVTYRWPGAGHAVIALGIRDEGSADRYEIVTLDSNFPAPSSPNGDPTYGIILVHGNHYATIPGNHGGLSQPLTADSFDVVPMSSIATVFPRASWTTPPGSLARLASMNSSNVVVRTASTAIVQLNGSGTELFAADGSVDRSAAGIPHVVFDTDDTGTDSLVEAPQANYTLTVAPTGLGEVEVNRGALTTRISLPATTKPVKITIPADASRPITVTLSGQAVLSLVQRVPGGDFRMATLQGSSGIGASLTQNGELRVAGGASTLTLSALGRHYTPQTVHVDLGGTGAATVTPGWAGLAAKAVVVTRGAKHRSIRAWSVVVLQRAGVTVAQKGRRVRVALEVRAPRGSTITARVTLQRGGHVVKRWTATSATANWTVSLPHHAYQVTAAIAAVAPTAGYRIERRVIHAHT